MSCKEIHRGWEGGKGQEMCSEEQTQGSAAAVWARGAQAPALRHEADTECGSLHPLPLLSHGCPGDQGSVGTGRGGPSTTPPSQLPSHPALVHAPRWRNSLNELAVAGSALAVGCAGQEQPFCTS